MTTISTDTTSIDVTELRDLYAHGGWVSVDHDPESLRPMLERLDGVVTAQAEGKLIGFVKILSDGAFYTTVAEIVVHPEWQRQGIGRRMMKRVEEDWGDTPIFIIGFDYNREFFEKCGYISRPQFMVATKLFRRGS